MQPHVLLAQLDTIANKELPHLWSAPRMLTAQLTVRYLPNALLVITDHQLEGNLNPTAQLVQQTKYAQEALILSPVQLATMGLTQAHQQPLLSLLA